MTLPPIPAAPVAATGTAAPSAPAAPHITLTPREPATRAVAVLVMHGMGQQVPFQTLDQVAQGLLSEPGMEREVTARAVRHENETLHRLEMRAAADASAGAADVHVYEAYWAPLTEGKITLRDVIRFLAGAGLNGIRNAAGGTFQRWVMGKFRDYPIASRTLIYLLVALGVIAALVVLNSAIGLVAAGTLLGQRATWVTPGLVADLTTTFNAVVLAMLAAAIPLGVTAWLRAKRGRGGRFLPRMSATLLIVATAVVILAGAAIPLLFYGHVRGGMSPGARMWTRAFDPAAVAGFDRWAGILLFGLAALAAAAFIWKAVSRFASGLLADRRLNASKSVAVYLGFVALVALVAALATTLWSTFSGAAGGGIRALLGGQLVWPLLVVASARVRAVLVQYMGDVAIYVMPYKLDAFDALRKQIKERALRVGRAVYAMERADGQGGMVPAYDSVVVVGHSLGSVVAYDMLNELLLRGGAGGIAERTSMLLTFGSPLDKTAFIFSLQSSGTSEAREALAGTKQPLIQSYDSRPARWVNVHSPWDIIAGGLDFYDPRTGDVERHAAKAVRDVVDTNATTPLVAHTEYWLPRTVLWKTLAEQLRTLRPAPGVRAGAGALGTSPNG